MAAGTDDPLARMARWDELRRRLEAATGGVAGTPLEDLAQAARRVVEQHQGMSVMITMQAEGRPSSVRVARVDGEVTVTVTDGPGELPHRAADEETAVVRAPDDTPRVVADGNDTAARLADLLRRDPSLLLPPDEHPH